MEIVFRPILWRLVLSLGEAEKIARKVVTMAKLGDLNAVNIIADRLDGKPQQSLDIADERTTHDLAAAFEQILASTASPTEPDNHWASLRRMETAGDAPLAPNSCPEN
jgi:hypothetical protein